MFGKKLKSGQLQARKRLLIAESEINRVLLAQEYEALAEDARQTLDQVKNVSVLGSLSAALMVLLKSLGKRRAGEEARKPSWLANSVKWIRIALPLWLSRRRNGAMKKEAAQKQPSPN